MKRPGRFGVAALAAWAEALRARRVTPRWQRPARFERNLIVIGAGAAGLVAAQVAAGAQAKVTLVEKHRMGGDCLHSGCVPSKALLRTARLLGQLRRAADYGLRSAHADFDFAEVMERVQRVVAAVAPHDSVERYTALGVECLPGEARIVSPWEVEVRQAGGASRRLSTRAIVIAAGARPLVPPIPGIEQSGYLTSDTVWSLRRLPARLLVLGGGPLGCELAQAFARLGSQVTLVEMQPRILMREDPEVSAMIAARLRAEGIELRTGHRARSCRVEDGRRRLIAEHAQGELGIEFDALLCALGRVPNTQGYGLEELGIPLTPAGTIATNARLQTSYPNIYACGDVAGPFQFTHVAAHQAWIASANALLGALGRFRAERTVLPRATFTDPEVARVGLNETEAMAANLPYEVTRYDIGDLDRAIADAEPLGMVKVLTAPGRDRILGATVVGAHAGETIGEFVTAMRHRLGLGGILGTMHVYPTFSEANRYAAGAWRRAHVPQALLRAAQKFHAWRRR